MTILEYGYFHVAIMDMSTGIFREFWVYTLKGIPGMTIIEQPLTLNRYSRPGTALKGVMALIMHWTATPGQSARGVWKYYESDEAAADHFGSAHYIVDLDGTILHAIPETEVAYHVGSTERDPGSGRIYTNWARAQFGDAFCDPATIGPNAVTLGVEMCVVDNAGNFTEQTLYAATELAADICIRRDLNPFSEVATHNMVVGWKDCPRLWVNHPDLLGDFRSEVASLISKTKGGQR